MKKSGFLRIVVAGWACAAAVPALSATIVTYSGTVTGGIDQTGVFGLAGQSLAGKSFVAVLTVDATPSHIGYNNLGSWSFVNGNGANNPVSAAITINNITQNISSSGTSSSTGYAGINGKNSSYSGSPSYSEHLAWQYHGSSYNRDELYLMLSSYINDINPTNNVLAPFSYTAAPSDSTHFSSRFHITDATGGSTRYANGSLSISSVSAVSSLTSAVPEPTTWAMMIGGFGMVGGAMRSARRKQKVTVSYA